MCAGTQKQFMNFSPACPNHARRIPPPPARGQIQTIRGLAVRAPIFQPIHGREMHLALALPVGRVNLARDDGGRTGGRARRPRRQRLVAQEPVPRPPGVAQRARLKEGVEQVVRVEAPEGVVLAPGVEVGACCLWKGGLLDQGGDNRGGVGSGQSVLLESRKFNRK